uniref:GAGE domain-containing protein n=1 Tax=Bursaphelenchus xylophilus TaxID=6326 RepID=A0A1I7SD49_BURXY
MDVRLLQPNKTEDRRLGLPEMDVQLQDPSPVEGPHPGRQDETAQTARPLVLHLAKAGGTFLSPEGLEHEASTASRHATPSSAP